MSCCHLNEFKAKHGFHSYKTIYSFFVKGKYSKQHKVWSSCFHCGNEVNRILACLFCIFLGCYDEHIQIHLNDKGHKLYVELSNGFIFCTICKDHVYDKDYDEVALKKSLLIPTNGFHYFRWRPSEKEVVTLKQNKKFIQLIPDEKFKIRGIHNMTSTCFINSVMQTLFHTTVLRDYFLSEKHICHVPMTNDCILCHFSYLFQEYYTDSVFPLSLHENVYLVWNRYPHFKGNGEHDAHEFFLATLDMLAQNSRSDQGYIEHPTSLTDAVFQGKLQQDLWCKKCCNTSSKTDSFLNVSLEIPDSPTNLIEVLTYFTRKESLNEIACDTCKASQEGTIQMIFQTLPIVIVIQLKRFESSVLVENTVKKKKVENTLKKKKVENTLKKKVENTSKEIKKVTIKKKETLVSFPLDLDMSPYMSGLRNNSNSEDSNVTELNNENRYTLYSVIEHLGNLSNGHYRTFIRHQLDTWYKCNDSTVEPADVETVLAAQGYLLFYHKNVLD